MRNRRRRTSRGRRVPAPAWACGEPGCPRYVWQPVSAMGEYDPIDAAMADLEKHYRRDHPDLWDHPGLRDDHDEETLHVAAG